MALRCLALVCCLCLGAVSAFVSPAVPTQSHTTSRSHANSQLHAGYLNIPFDPLAPAYYHLELIGQAEQAKMISGACV